MDYKQQQEMKARAEHLKKQRDLLLAQRKKAREADLANYTPPPPPPAAPPAPTAAEIAAAPPPGSMRGKAGYSEAKTESIDAQRAQLSRSLAASMKANLLGAGDVEEQLFADKERKADLEATKAALRHQVAAERSRGF